MGSDATAGTNDDIKVFYVGDVEGLTLTDAHKTELRTWMAAGGTLIVGPSGGFFFFLK